MTDSPVAVANARTMWKREIPPTPAISSRVNSSARWLSIYQSAFWAGFMDHGLHSKRPHHDRFARAAFDSPCSRSLLRNRNRTHVFFRCTENSSKAVAGNNPPIGLRFAPTRWLAMTILNPSCSLNTLDAAEL